MELPELPPGSPLDPGWTDGYRHRPAGPFRKGLGTQRVAAARHDNRELMEQNAVAQVLRDERINLWRDLWQGSVKKDEEIRALKAEVRRLRRRLAR